ncbi:DivIVA domain-containing protein [Cellulomonas septica]|uniref:DivIVA domain-containing protein n=1 Tax=Cellulomonas septica TaxID=285080 RepID=UPI0031B6385B
MLTADDVLRATFTATKFRDGYDQLEVDDLLDRVARTLRARESGAAVADAVTVAEVDAARFAVRRFTEGYDQVQVDDLLAEVRATLAAPAPPRPAVATSPASGDVPGLLPSKAASGWRRLFGR